MNKHDSPDFLREKYPTFVYQNASYSLENDQLILSFSYMLETELSFEHQVIIDGVSQQMFDALSEEDLQQYVFHIGMIEAFSYWKLACSPQFLVEAGPLTESQIDWWETLLVKGMGEYFYVNQVDFTADRFISITSNQRSPRPLTLESTKSSTIGIENQKPSVLIPLGGGKDSALTLALLTKQHNAFSSIGTLLINPTQAAIDTAQVGAHSLKHVEVSSLPLHRVTRRFDPLLFALNDEGYLNGHVPVSASIAFISVLVGRVFDYTHIILSNERSSNEGNVQYLGHTINHQYSKTFAFEHSFNTYTREHLPSKTPFYFSFLRPLYELQIARLFARYGQEYLSLFRSCNRGQKTNSWCGECPKCLFAWVALFPWLGEEKMVEIFGKNLFDNTTLHPIALELLGKAQQKPFECVGTHEETQLAFGLCLHWYAEEQKTIPALLKTLLHEEHITASVTSSPEAANILEGWDENTLLPPDFSELLKTALEN